MRLLAQLEAIRTGGAATEAVGSLVEMAFADGDAATRGLAVSVLLELRTVTESSPELSTARDRIDALVADNLGVGDQPAGNNLGLVWLASVDGLWLAKGLLESINGMTDQRSSGGERM